VDVDDLARAAGLSRAHFIVLPVYGRPQRRTFREDSGPARQATTSG
jgi:hypothetical protein